ncbi:MAG: anti-sigma factor, partial [Propionivibrio sp.]
MIVHHVNSPISEDDLHAYADGQLVPGRLTQVEAWLAAHPERRLETEDRRAQSARLHGAYDHVLAEPVPARLLPASNAPRWLAPRKVAAVAWLTLGAVVGYVLRAETALPAPAPVAMNSLPRQAAVAHAVFVPEVRHPVEVGADQEAHLVGW